MKGKHKELKKRLDGLSDEEKIKRIRRVMDVSYDNGVTLNPIKAHFILKGLKGPNVTWPKVKKGIEAFKNKRTQKSFDLFFEKAMAGMWIKW